MNETETANAMERNNFPELLKRLLPRQLDFIAARLQCTSDAEAANMIGIRRATVCEWKRDGYPIEEVIQAAKMDGILVAQEKLRRAAPQAVDALVRELHGKEAVAAARAILDRAGLEAGSKLGITAGVYNIDFTQLTDEQLERIANGEDPLSVLATSAPGESAA